MQFIKWRIKATGKPHIRSYVPVTEIQPGVDLVHVGAIHEAGDVHSDLRNWPESGFYCCDNFPQIFEVWRVIYLVKVYLGDILLHVICVTETVPLSSFKLWTNHLVIHQNRETLKHMTKHKYYARHKIWSYYSHKTLDFSPPQKAQTYIRM